MPPQQGVGAQRRRDAQARRSREMVVARHRRVRPGQRVVDEEARPHDEAVPRGTLQGEEEGRRPDEVWGERLEQQAAFVQRLADELHVEVLEVAQASVDELARTARRAGGEVALLDERDREAPAGRVERDAAAGHPAADHEDVEGLGGQALAGLSCEPRDSTTTRAHPIPSDQLPSVLRTATRVYWPHGPAAQSSATATTHIRVALPAPRIVPHGRVSSTWRRPASQVNILLIRRYRRGAAEWLRARCPVAGGCMRC